MSALIVWEPSQSHPNLHLVAERRWCRLGLVKAFTHYRMCLTKPTNCVSAESTPITSVVGADQSQSFGTCAKIRKLSSHLAHSPEWSDCDRIWTQTLQQAGHHPHAGTNISRTGTNPSTGGRNLGKRKHAWTCSPCSFSEPHIHTDTHYLRIEICLILCITHCITHWILALFVCFV